MLQRTSSRNRDLHSLTSSMIPLTGGSKGGVGFRVCAISHLLIFPKKFREYSLGPP